MKSIFTTQQGRDPKKKKLTAGSGELECSEANVIESLVVQNHTLICVFNKLVNRESCIVRLNDGV